MAAPEILVPGKRQLFEWVKKLRERGAADEYRSGFLDSTLQANQT